MLSKTVDNRVRKIAEAVFLRYKIMKAKGFTRPMMTVEVMSEVRKFCSHFKTRQFYFDELKNRGFIQLQKDTPNKQQTWIPVDPSTIEEYNVEMYLENLKKELEKAKTEQSEDGDKQ